MMLEIINIPRSPDVSLEHHPDTMAALITVKFLKSQIDFCDIGERAKRTAVQTWNKVLALSKTERGIKPPRQGGDVDHKKGLCVG